MRRTPIRGRVLLTYIDHQRWQGCNRRDRREARDISFTSMLPRTRFLSPKHKLVQSSLLLDYRLWPRIVKAWALIILLVSEVTVFVRLEGINESVSEVLDWLLEKGMICFSPRRSNHIVLESRLVFYVETLFWFPSFICIKLVDEKRRITMHGDIR